MGKSSSVVSLPKKWIDSARLKAGSNIYIDISANGDLILKPEGVVKEAREVTLNIDSEVGKKHLQRILISRYLSGFERINIESKEIISPALREEIAKAAGSLIGLEVVEEGMKRISIECLVKPTELPIEKIIRRMYLLTKDLHKSALEVIAQKDKTLVNNVIEREGAVKRLYYLSVRYLNLATAPGSGSQLDISAQDCLHYQSITKYLERIADRAKSMAKYLSQLNVKRTPKSLLEWIKKISIVVNDMFDESMKAFFREDVVLANSVIDKIAWVRNEVNSRVVSVMKLRNEAAVNIGLALYSTMRIAEHSGEIAEVVIARAA